MDDNVDFIPGECPDDYPVDGVDPLEALIQLERHRRQIAALEASLLVQVAGEHTQHHRVAVLDAETGRERILDIPDEAREEIAAALSRSPSVVHDQLITARLLFGPLARTRDALADGAIGEGHAHVIAEGAELLHRSLGTDATTFQKTCDALQDRVLKRAQSCTRAQLRRLVRTAVAQIDAEGERERRRHASKSADVCVYPDEHGQSVLLARMATLDAQRILAAVNAHARSDDLTTPCDASVGERRVAALLALVCGTDGGSVGAVVGAEITVTTTLTDLLDGSGPVAALLDDPDVPLTLRRLITDPQTGRALDLGRRRYQVSDALRRWIVARDVTCRFPGCSRRASACQIDHVRGWKDGGATDGDNLEPLCVRHHQLKTHGGWSVTRDDRTGLFVWTAPSGHMYWVDPDPPPF